AEVDAHVDGGRVARKGGGRQSADFAVALGLVGLHVGVVGLVGAADARADAAGDSVRLVRGLVEIGILYRQGRAGHGLVDMAMPVLDIALLHEIFRVEIPEFARDLTWKLRGIESFDASYAR